MGYGRERNDEKNKGIYPMHLYLDDVGLYGKIFTQI